MANVKDFRAALVELLISDNETAGRPVVAPEQRAVVEEGARWLVLNVEALREHERWLGAIDRAKRHQSILEEGRFQEVLDGGLEALDNEELARLALNPIALFDLTDAIAELFPVAWMPQIEQAAAALVRDHESLFSRLKLTPTLPHPPGSRFVEASGMEDDPVLVAKVPVKAVPRPLCSSLEPVRPSLERKDGPVLKLLAGILGMIYSGPRKLDHSVC